jgi:hypothetical protein
MNKMMKRYAFISYNHHDVSTAKWLQKRLESYKLPTDVSNEFEDTRYLRPVFRDQTDLNTGILSEELKKNLESSKFLIVICSPHSAASQWVNEEVRTFIQWGRLYRIIPFIIEGEPHGALECYPQALLQLNSDKELLGININEVGREQAFVRLVSRMLDVDFDVLWNRYERERKMRILSYTIATIATAAILAFFALPVTLSIDIKDDTHQLPLPNGAVLTVDDKEYMINNLDTVIHVESLPGYYRLRSIPIQFHATFYDSISTNASLGVGTMSHYILSLHRDATFSHFAGYVLNENSQPIEDANIDICGKTTRTDANGHFDISFDLQEQTATKPIIITHSRYSTFSREDECPDTLLIYILHL